MSGFDFESALDTKAAEVEKPPVIPQGTYIWSVTKPPVPAKTKNGEWSIVEFIVKGVEATDDVDPDDLEDFGKVSKAISRVTFMAPATGDNEAEVKATLWKIKNFCLNTLRVDAEEDTSIKELLALSANCQFYATAQHRMYEGETFFDLKNLAPLD